MDALLDIDNLQATKPESNPYPHLIVPRFLAPSRLEAIGIDFPTTTEPRNHDVRRLEYGPTFARLLEQFAEREWMEILGSKIGVPNLADLPYDTTIRTRSEASDGNIHTDHWSKLATVLIYPNLEWTAAGGRLRILRSKTDLEDYATEVVPADGTMLAFRRTPWSFHGHHKYVGPRLLIQISWLRRSPLARAWHGVSRHGTHLAKRAGLHSDD